MPHGLWERSYGRKVEPLWLYRYKGNRTPVRKVAGPTDKSERVAARSFAHTYPVLILLPPSEKKALAPGAAIDVYMGVLYKALDWASLTQPQRAVGQRSIAIISAKYGVLRPLDPIEAYKEIINNAVMRKPVTDYLEAIKTDLIIDCRSSTYQGVWTPPFNLCVEIKVFTELNGVKKIITHMSKKTRGEVTRILLQEVAPTNPKELCTIISRHFKCSLIEATEHSPWVLEVIAH